MTPINLKEKPRCGMRDDQIKRLLAEQGITDPGRARSYIRGWRQVKCSTKTND